MADNVTLPGAGAVVATDDDGAAQHQYVKVEFGADGTFSKVATTTPLPVNLPSVVSTANSTTSVLAGGAVFTGTSEDVSDFAQILVSVFTSHASATDGLSVQQSSDGTNWDVTDVYTIGATAAGQGKTFSFQPAAKFFRIVYTNGATLQTSFRLQTVFHRAPTKASSQRPADAVSNENDFEQASTFNMVFNGTTWDRQRGDITNGMDVDVTRIIPGTAATNLGKAEDAVAASGDTGVFTLGVIRASPAINAATGDYGEMAISPGERPVRRPFPDGGGDGVDADDHGDDVHVRLPVGFGDDDPCGSRVRSRRPDRGGVDRGQGESESSSRAVGVQGVPDVGRGGQRCVRHHGREPDHGRFRDGHRFRGSFLR